MSEPNPSESDMPAPDFTPKPPAESELPQGADAFIQAHGACYAAVSELFTPYVNRHPGLARNFEQVMIKLREAGFWVNDSINMMLRPELQPRPPAKEAPGVEAP